jgi:hypothetical protein
MVWKTKIVDDRARKLWQLGELRVLGLPGTGGSTRRPDKLGLASSTRKLGVTGSTRRTGLESRTRRHGLPGRASRTRRPGLAWGDGFYQVVIKMGLPWGGRVNPPPWGRRVNPSR